MKIKDFEKAIDELDCDIRLDECRLTKGQVRCCLGHTEHELLLWDTFGRAFGICRHGEVCTGESHEKFEECDYDKRMADYDLKL